MKKKRSGAATIREHSGFPWRGSWRCCDFRRRVFGRRCLNLVSGVFRWRQACAEGFARLLPGADDHATLQQWEVQPRQQLAFAKSFVSSRRAEPENLKLVLAP